MFFIEFDNLTEQQIEILTTHILDKKNGLIHDLLENKDDGHFVVVINDMDFNDAVFVLSSTGLLPKISHSS